MSTAKNIKVYVTKITTYGGAVPLNEGDYGKLSVDVEYELFSDNLHVGAGSLHNVLHGDDTAANAKISFVRAVHDRLSKILGVVEEQPEPEAIPQGLIDMEL